MLKFFSRLFTGWLLALSTTMCGRYAHLGLQLKHSNVLGIKTAMVWSVCEFAILTLR